MLVEISMAGTYPQDKWDKERCQRLVDSYEPDNYIEAPCVIGHNSWVGKANKDGATAHRAGFKTRGEKHID